MLANQKREDLRRPDIQEDVTREDIVAAFRTAMIGHFRSHIPGTNINESTLLASDYLNHFHELVMLLGAVSSEPKEFAKDLQAWHPLTYEEHFSESGFREKSLAIAAYHQAPPKIRARFDEAVARLHGEAINLIGEVSMALKNGKQRKLRAACDAAGERLRILIDEANTIATGETKPQHTGNGRAETDPDVSGGQAAIDALFPPR